MLLRTIRFVFAAIIVCSATAVQAAALSDLAKGEMQNVAIHSNPQPLPPLKFKNGAGKDLTLGDFRGKVLFLNLWATWCAPCRHEMPGIDKLQAELGGDDFQVLAISIDRAGAKKAQAFLDQIKADNLDLYIDKTTKISRKLRAFGLPISLIIDRKGREIARLAGPAEWASPDALALIRAAIAGK